jgi:hypothetical protein
LAFADDKRELIYQSVAFLVVNCTRAAGEISPFVVVHHHTEKLLSLHSRVASPTEFSPRTGYFSNFQKRLLAHTYSLFALL